MNENGMQPLTPYPDQKQVWLNYRGNPVSFEEAYRQIMAHHREDGERRDMDIVGIRTWAFGTSDGQHMAIRPIPFPGRPDPDRMYPLRKTAFSQLVGRVGTAVGKNIPAEYILSLPAKLQMAAMNYEMSSADRDAKLRLAGHQARALVSTRYADVDDDFYLKVVNDTLVDLGYRNDAICRVVASGPHTVIRVTIPNESQEFRVGDRIEFGIDISNSEIGRRSNQVTPITYRLVCLNGMRNVKTEGNHRRRHIGDRDAIHEWLRDAVPVSFAEARGDMDLWKKATERLIDDAFAEIEGLVNLGFSKPERDAVAHQLVADTGMNGRNVVELLKNTHTTPYDVANAITAVAQSRQSSDDDVVRIESRLTMEEAGYAYLRRRAA